MLVQHFAAPLLHHFAALVLQHFAAAARSNSLLACGHVMTSRAAPHIDIRTNLACEPDFLIFLSSAYILSATVFSGVELGVFDRLARGPRTLSELATDVSTPPDALERLLLVLLAIGLVERDANGAYRNHATASALLVADSTTSLRAFMLHQQRHIYPLFTHLTDALRSGQAQTFHWPFASGTAGGYPALMENPAESRLFLEAMNTAATGVGEVIAKRVDLSQIHTLVDFGGGGGQIAIELARAAPHLAIQIVDYPHACRFADEVIARHGLSDRISTVSGDFLGELSCGPVDAVLLGGVLADWDSAQRSVLLANARRCLRPGGRLLVSETLLDESNDGPLLPAMLSLTMLLGARGKNFTPAELTKILAAADFGDISVFNNRELRARDLVVAVRR